MGTRQLRRLTNILYAIRVFATELSSESGLHSGYPCHCRNVPSLSSLRYQARQRFHVRRSLLDYFLIAGLPSAIYTFLELPRRTPRLYFWAAARSRSMARLTARARSTVGASKK